MADSEENWNENDEGWAEGDNNDNNDNGDWGDDDFQDDGDLTLEYDKEQNSKAPEKNKSSTAEELVTLWTPSYLNDKNKINQNQHNTTNTNNNSTITNNNVNDSKNLLKVSTWIDEDVKDFCLNFRLVLLLANRPKDNPLSKPDLVPIRVALERLYGDAIKLRNVSEAKHYAVNPLGHNKNKSSPNSNECQVCYSQLTNSKSSKGKGNGLSLNSNENDSPTAAEFILASCKHNQACKDCLTGHITSRITSCDIIPFIPCPAANCGVPIDAADLVRLMSDSQLVDLVAEHMSRLIVRCPYWVPCKGTDKCRFGFLVLANDSQPKQTKSENNNNNNQQDNNPLVDRRKCLICRVEQVVEKPRLEDEMDKLVKAGTLRACPQCNELAMRDKGMCNVMQCGKCSVWWNWTTREFGNNSRELKERARIAGTLWEPGELAYQQKLQQSDPAAFKKLLEDNGIQYDPNYVRGQGI